MTLWLPLLDSAKSYQPVFSSLNKALTKNDDCINSLHIERQQGLLVNYYTDIKLKPVENAQQAGCDLLLVFDRKGGAPFQPDAHWQNSWSGKRPADRKEGFRLFKRIP